MENNQIIEQVTSGEYKYGFYTDIEMDMAPKGLNEDIIRFISQKKSEPDWLLEWRLKAYRLANNEATKLGHLNIPPIDYNDIIYYAAPKSKRAAKS